MRANQGTSCKRTNVDGHPLNRGKNIAKSTRIQALYKKGEKKIKQSFMKMRIGFKTINSIIKLLFLLIFCVFSSCMVNYLQINEKQTDGKLAGLYCTNFHVVDTGEPFREYLYLREDSSVFYFHSTFDCDVVHKSKIKIMHKAKYFIKDNKIEFVFDYLFYGVKQKNEYSCKVNNNSLSVIRTTKVLDDTPISYNIESVYYKCEF